MVQVQAQVQVGKVLGSRGSHREEHMVHHKFLAQRSSGADPPQPEQGLEFAEGKAVALALGTESYNDPAQAANMGSPAGCSLYWRRQVQRDDERKDASREVSEYDFSMSSEGPS